MPTPEFNAEDAVVSIGLGYAIVDEVMYLVGLLREEWKPENTDGVMPSIDFAEVTKDFVFRYPNDYIVAYTTNMTTEPVTITYGWQNEDHHFMLDFFSGGDRSHANKFLEEARRIMHNHRFDTFGDSEGELTGRHWLHYAAYTQPMDLVNKHFYRRKVESVLHIRFRQIKT